MRIARAARVATLLATLLVAGVAGPLALVLVASMLGPGDVVDGSWRPPPAAAGQRTVLVAGIDRHDPRQDRGRADALLVLRLDGDSAAMLSIPRNLDVIGPDGARQEVARVYQQAGAGALAAAVEGALDVRLDHVVVVQLEAARQLVDGIGGVRIRNDRDLVTRFDGGTWRFPSGALHLDGRRAQAYARARTNLLDASETDSTRGQRQQAVLHAAARRLASPSTWPAVPITLARASAHVDTDVGVRDAITLARLARRAGRVRSCRIGARWTSPRQSGRADPRAMVRPPADPDELAPVEQPTLRPDEHLDEVVAMFTGAIPAARIDRAGPFPGGCSDRPGRWAVGSAAAR